MGTANAEMFETASDGRLLIQASHSGIFPDQAITGGLDIYNLFSGNIPDIECDSYLYVEEAIAWYKHERNTAGIKDQIKVEFLIQANRIHKAERAARQ